MPSEPPTTTPRPALAAVLGVPVGAIGGLLGLGGAEFRLPLLKAFFGASAHRAVALNLAVSLVTLAASLAIRSTTGPAVDATLWWPPVLGLASGATIAAWVSAGRIGRLSAQRLERAIVALLVVIGVLLMVEAFVVLAPSALVTGDAVLPVAFVLGVGVGVISSLLGVAGGEILIPTFVLVFGADVKVAGTLSVMVSLPTVLAGVVRHARAGSFRHEDLRTLIVPMGAGSVIGAFAGGALVPWAPGRALKITLGALLIFSAWKVFASAGKRPASP